MARGHFNKFADVTQDIERNMRAEAEGSPSNNRRHGRIRPSALSCNLGTLLDLSASGLRLLSRRPLEGVVPVVLNDTNTTVKVQARVVWCTKKGFRKHEVGLEFTTISPEDSATLRAMAVA